MMLMTLLSIGSAQVWCPPGATWTYSGGDPMIGPAQTHFTFVGDTLVDGFVGQRIEQLNALLLPVWAGDSLLITEGPDVVTRTEPGMVLWWLAQTQEWDTLYWFGAQPGDRWSPGWAQQFSFGNACATGSYLVVVDTGTTVVDGVTLRTLDLGRHQGGTGPDLDFTIMERIGNTSGYLFPYPPDICFVNEALMTLSCYSDAEIRFPPSSTPCELTLGVREANTVQLGLMPNPTDGLLYVRLTGNADRAFSVWAADGRRVEVAGTPTAHGLQLDASELAPGVYVLRTPTGQARFVKR